MENIRQIFYIRLHFLDSGFRYLSALIKIGVFKALQGIRKNVKITVKMLSGHFWCPLICIISYTFNVYETKKPYISIGLYSF